jgi:CBS domain-containing protein
MQVQDIMTTDLAYCAPDADIGAIASLMVEHDCGAIPVVDPKTRRTLGVVTDRDIVCRAVAKQQNPLKMKASDIMSMPIAGVRPDTSLQDCLIEMEATKIRRVFVIDDYGTLCGIVSQADIARVAPYQNTAELVKDISRPNHYASGFH